MRGLSVVLAIVLIGILSFLPTAGWAMMCQSHGGSHGSHGDHQGSHENQGDHQEHGDRQEHMGMNGHYETMDKVFGEYFAIQSQLANDSMEGVSGKAEALAEAAEEFRHDFAETARHEHESHMHEIVNGIGSNAKSLAKTKDLDSARKEFAKLSENLVEYQKMCGKKHSHEAHAFVCDMAKKVWLQEGEEPRNPYYGSAMLRCARKLQ